MPVKILRIIVGSFFILLGLAGVLTNVEESIWSLNNGKIWLEQIFGIVEIICGIILILGLFNLSGRKNTLYIASMVVFVFWIIRIILSNFVWGTLPAMNLTLIIWLVELLAEAVIASAIWVLAKVYE